MAASAGTRAHFARDLRDVFLTARRIARQLRGHATGVPYERLAPALRALADQADGQAATLAAELHAVAGNADPADTATVREGRNHWERLTFDVADLDALKRRYLDLALHWDVEFPSAAATLVALGHATAVMSAVVRDMVARSDPHAA